MLSFYVIIFFVYISKINSTLDGKWHFKMDFEYFCVGNNKIYSEFYQGLKSGYSVTIAKELEAATEIIVKLDSGGAIDLDNLYNTPQNHSRFFQRDLINNIYGITMRHASSNFTFTVKGRDAPAHPPYILSLKIEGVENCINPNRTYFENHDVEVEPYWPEASDNFCGRRRINREYTELIVSGSSSESGDWPWHTAIYRNYGHTVEYICGGSLISKFIVLTAAHCVTINAIPVNPEMLGVVLGKFSLFGSESTTQHRTVYQVIIHDGFNKINLDNDIALLKLSSEAHFNNYVQPACLWDDKAYNQLHSYEISGTIVGWGIDQTDIISNKLHEANVPLVPISTCISYEPVFYGSMLTDKKFCAGYANGTAACNGDSGGGFAVFVRDSRQINKGSRYYEYLGAWYVRGIISVTMKRSSSSLCDPQAYTVLTDVAKYRDWIQQYMY